MATLEEALTGLNYTPLETGYGIAAQTVGQMAPQLINPYGSTGQAIGIGLGSILLQSLLGYQARQQAAQDTLELNSLANQLMTKTTPESRTEFIGGVSDPMSQSRLSTLSTALLQQEATRKIKQAEKLADLTTAAEFEMGPLGTALAARKAQQAIDIAQAGRIRSVSEEKPKKDWWEKVPAAQKTAFTGTAGQVEQLRQLANTFKELGSNAVELNLEKQIPGSKADLALSAMQTLVPSTVKMLGDTGALSAYDQEAVKKATLGGRLSGAQSIAARLEQLANLAETKTTTALEQYRIAAEKGGTGLLEQLKSGTDTSTNSEARKEELRRQIAEIKTLLEQRRK
jgi:hypothetical protein